MTIQLEGYKVPLSAMPRTLLRRDFWAHYFHKWVLCKFGRHQYQTMVSMAARECKYCKDIMVILESNAKK